MQSHFPHYEQQAAKSRRILVVDDEGRNRRLLEDLLVTLGYTAESAADGPEALKKLNTGFDLVLLDVIMPGMDGFEVVRRIRDDPRVSDIPIIMVTVLNDQDTRLRAVRAGANDFIAKPIDAIEVSVRVASLIRMKQAQDAIKRHRAELEQTVEERTADLLDSESRFKTLIEAARDGIFIKDGDLKYTDVNAALAALFDMQPSDITGKTDRDLFGGDVAIQNEKIELRVMNGETINTQERFVYRSLPIHVDCVRFPLWGPSKEIRGIGGILREMVIRPELWSADEIDSRNYPSAAIRATLDKALLAASTNGMVLLTGESGSGKDHLARYIHDHSMRNRGPFYSVNCAAIPSELAESELFGYEAGAFTGAVRRKRGLVELAEGGTLLLNEIGELSPVLQGKLLTFLDTFSFTRVGGERSHTVSIRLIAATSKDMEAEVAESRFRRDLYYRLNVFPIRLPALRERSEDIPVLVQKLLLKLVAKLGLPATPEVELDAVQILCRYSWPGNVRELMNILERSLMLSRGETIRASHLNLGETSGTHVSAGLDSLPGRSLSAILDETERSLIQEALRRSGGTKSVAARTLGISSYALARHMAKLGLQ